MKATQSVGYTKVSKPILGVALIFDIIGFTKFYNKPDIQHYITGYLNHIIECVEINFWGGDSYWFKTPGYDNLPALAITPSMKKFLGDGMLYIWENNKQNSLSDNKFKFDLLNRIWNIQQHFGKINLRLLQELPNSDLPVGIKFGIAKGTIFKIKDKHGNVDYIGPCINMASRLVKYCEQINFIASSRFDISKELLDKHRYIRVIAKDLRNFENEIVIIDKIV